MTKSEYKWKKKATTKLKNVSKVVAALDAARSANHGELTPPAIVEAARAHDAYLHDCFEWDDTIAGERWREEQAADLIRYVEITIAGDEPITVRAYVSLPNPDAGKPGSADRIYVKTTEVLSHKQMRAQMVADALAEFERFRSKYRQLSELAAVFAAFDKLKKRKRA